MESDLYENLLVELECPICTNYMSPPIRQCATGHSVCEICRRKLSKCALCQSKFTESRNLCLEGLAVKMRYPCINKNLGCNVKLSYTERETHELHCTLKGFKCPMERCNWVGNLKDLVAHWETKKIISKPYGKSTLCHTKIKAESYYVNMVQAYDQMFWFKCKIINNKIYWAVQFIGNQATAENYCYEIEIFKPIQPKKKLVIADYCQTVDLENSQLFDDNACSAIAVESLGNFLNNEQILIYYLRVSEVNGEEKDANDAQEESSCSNNADNKSNHPPLIHYYPVYPHRRPYLGKHPRARAAGGPFKGLRRGGAQFKPNNKNSPGEGFVFVGHNMAVHHKKGSQ